MKSTYIFFTVALLCIAGLLSSCKKTLDVLPKSQLSEQQFWKTNSDAQLGVAAIYDAMQNTYRLKHYLWGEFRADNFVATNNVSVDYLELVTNTITPSNQNTLRWNDFYQLIGRANLAIKNIPNIAGYDGNLLGESYALRAYAYFDAMRVWGGAPLFLEPITGLDQNLTRPKSDSATLMDSVVIPDMLRAEKFITVPTNNFRFSKASLYCFEAEVYMWLHQYDKAKIAIDKLIALNAYSLTTDRLSWTKLFLNDAANNNVYQTGPELILSIKYDLLEDGARASGNFELFYAGIPNFYLSPALENKWTALFPTDSVAWYAKYPGIKPLPKNPDGSTLFGDWRYFESRETGAAIGAARPAKYEKTNNSILVDNTNIVLYRYAGMLLLKAEAENRLGNKATAVSLINQVRVARQLPVVNANSFTTVDQLEDFILDERQLELFTEGKRWWDLRRTGRAVKVMGPINGQTDQKLLFPIYDRHLIDNPLLKQTPGY